eukprot:2922139-Rhodomonas_salina.4
MNASRAPPAPTAASFSAMLCSFLLLTSDSVCVCACSCAGMRVCVCDSLLLSACKHAALFCARMTAADAVSEPSGHPDPHPT